MHNLLLIRLQLEEQINKCTVLENFRKQGIKEDIEEGKKEGIEEKQG